MSIVYLVTAYGPNGAFMILDVFKSKSDAETWLDSLDKENLYATSIEKRNVK
ncbi:hypothetical protein [Enterococcus gallinarum]|uniref:hypothetical protein n=1 Tax=Enterococcus gallinarum TaxID=1353 RepID=UPI0018A98461|nr:hypothetical protein [Enterococcus gallinarum]